MLDFTKKEMQLLRKLNTPAKVQYFLNSLTFNFERDGKKKIQTLKSPLFTLRKGNAHCMEGALLGAYILSLHKFTPYLLHLKTKKNDFDHVIAPFKINGLWGALSKTNHAILRCREPVYKSIRELAMSYFHEYYLFSNGKKTLRKYSNPVNLKKFDKLGWMTTEKEVWDIANYIADAKHFPMLNKKQIMGLRKVDKIEIDVGKMTEWKSDKIKKDL